MAEEDKKKITEVLIGGTLYEFEEGQDQETVDKLTEQVESAIKTEGAWKISKDFLKIVSGITYNVGKEEVTNTDREIREIKRQNELLKTSIDDLRTQNEEIQKSMNVIPAKKVDPPKDPPSDPEQKDPPADPPKSDDKDPDDAAKKDPPKDPKDGDGTGGSE